MGAEMICDKGHEVESWIIKRGGKKRHRVHCRECRVVIDFYRKGAEIKQKRIEYKEGDEITVCYSTGTIRDAHYWATYRMLNRQPKRGLQ